VHRLANPLDGVQDARRGFAVDHGGVREGGSGIERFADTPGVHGFVLREQQRVGFDAEALRYLHHPPSVCAVDSHQKPPVARYRRTDRRLDGKRARALHEHRLVIVTTRTGEPNQSAPDLAHGRDELRIARAEIAHHGMLYRRAGAQRPRCEEKFFGHCFPW